MKHITHGMSKTGERWIEKNMGQPSSAEAPHGEWNHSARMLEDAILIIR